ncbi:putative PUA-like superfamily, SRA-YDG superfamily protein [Helianthus anomalus]
MDRSHKEKRSAYAPEQGVRYDGIYRIEKCWRKPGIQGFKVCRYLFVRCDNDPAPWTITLMIVIVLAYENCKMDSNQMCWIIILQR